MSSMRFLPRDFAFPSQFHMRAHTTYKEWYKTRHQYPPLSNLDEIVATMDTKNCLTMIDNFPLVNLFPIRNPWIVRHPTPVVMEYNISRGRYSYYRYAVEWGSLSLRDGNKTFPAGNYSISCTISRFLAGRGISVEDTSDVCILLEARKFIFNVKPWSCLLHLLVYPPLEILGKVQMKGHFNSLLPRAITPVADDKHGIFPTPVPNLKIMINKLMQNLKQKFSKLHVLQKWMNETNRASSTSHNIFIILTVRVKYDLPVANGYLEPSIISQIEVLKYCTDCFHSVDQSYINFESIVIENFPRNATEAISYAYPSSQEARNWQVEMPQIKTSEKYYFSERFIVVVVFCDLTNPTKFPENFLASKLASVWHSILRNYTLRSKTRKAYCENGLRLQQQRFLRQIDFQAELSIHPFIKGFEFHPEAILDPLYNLRFVSCGGGKRSIQYKELINIFDTHVWAFILSLIICASITLRTEIHDSAICILAIIKILLEQGTPFPSTVTNSPNLRYAAGSIVLIGIILSNAYKNTNVYNMVVPRGQVPFEAVSDLVAHNFTIYSRSASVVICHPAQQFQCDCRYGEVIQSRRTLRWLCVTSEVSYVTDKAIALMNRYGYASNNTFVAMVRNITKLHSTLVKILWETLDGLKMELANLVDLIPHNEPKMLYETLEKCDNVALILPEHLSRQNARKLESDGKLENVFVGKELYSNIQWYFAMKGIVHPEDIRRFKAIAPAGIWEWWMNLVMTNSAFHEMSQSFSPKPVSMNGNVVMIFSVWACGLAMAILLAISELTIYLVNNLLEKLIIRLKNVNFQLSV